MSKKIAQWTLMVGLAAMVAGSQRTVSAGSSSDSYARLIREAALVLLKEGNTRYAVGSPKRPNYDSARRVNTATEGQEPFATVVTCSDSRVPVEAILDRGVGDLFVIRVAGNVAGPSELASIEYGVNHLHTPLLIVMGHTQCGAVSAVVQGAPLHGHLHALAERIKPAAAKAAGIADPDLAVARAVEANVWQTVSDVLHHSVGVREAVAAGKVQVVGAIYNLGTGEVEWLGSHPGQEAMLSKSSPVGGTGLPGDADGQPDPHGIPAVSVHPPIPADPPENRRVRRSLLDPLTSPYMNPVEAAGPSVPSHGTPDPHGGHGHGEAAPHQDSPRMKPPHLPPGGAHH